MIIAVGFLILFTTQNTANVQIKFLFFTWSLPLIFLLYLILFGGFFIGYFYASLKGMTKSKKEPSLQTGQSELLDEPSEKKKSLMTKLFSKNKG